MISSDLFHEMASQVRMYWHYDSGDMMVEGIDVVGRNDAIGADCPLDCRSLI
jgi:hypothetical protein